MIPFCPLICITFFKMSEFRFLRKTRAFKHVYTRVFNTHLARGRQRYWSCRVSQVEADFYRSEMFLQTSLVLSLSFSRTICCGAALYGLSDTTETPHACVGQKPGLGQHVSVPGSPQEHCPTWTFSFCFQLFFLLLPLMSAASQWNHKENWSLAILLSPDLRYLKSKIFFSAFDLNNFVVVVNPQGYFKVKGFLLDPADLRFEDLFFRKAS